VAYHRDELVEWGLVAVDRSGSAHRVAPTERGRRVASWLDRGCSTQAVTVPSGVVHVSPSASGQSNSRGASSPAGFSSRVCEPVQVLFQSVSSARSSGEPPANRYPSSPARATTTVVSSPACAAPSSA